MSRFRTSNGGSLKTGIYLTTNTNESEKIIINDEFGVGTNLALYRCVHAYKTNPIYHFTDRDSEAAFLRMLRRHTRQYGARIRRLSRGVYEFEQTPIGASWSQYENVCYLMNPDPKFHDSVPLPEFVLSFTNVKNDEYEIIDEIIESTGFGFRKTSSKQSTLVLISSDAIADAKNIVRLFLAGGFAVFGVIQRPSMDLVARIGPSIFLSSVMKNLLAE